MNVIMWVRYGVIWLRVSDEHWLVCVNYWMKNRLSAFGGFVKGLAFWVRLFITNGTLGTSDFLTFVVSFC